MNEVKKSKKPYDKKSILNKKNVKAEGKKPPKKPTFFTMADFFHNTPGFSKFYKSLS